MGQTLEERLGKLILEHIDKVIDGRIETIVAQLTAKQSPGTLDFKYVAKVSKMGNVSKNAKKPKNKYGEFKRVLLTEDEYAKLLNDYGPAEVKGMIKNLDEYMEMKGAKYKNHSLTMRRWKAKENGELDSQKKTASATTDVFWYKCRECGHQQRKPGLTRCEKCQDFSWVQMRGAEYPEGV